MRGLAEMLAVKHDSIRAAGKSLNWTLSECEDFISSLVSLSPGVSAKLIDFTCMNVLFWAFCCFSFFLENKGLSWMCPWIWMWHLNFDTFKETICERSNHRPYYAAAVVPED